MVRRYAKFTRWLAQDGLLQSESIGGNHAVFQRKRKCDKKPEEHRAGHGDLDAGQRGSFVYPDSRRHKGHGKQQKPKDGTRLIHHVLATLVGTTALLHIPVEHGPERPRPHQRENDPSPTTFTTSSRHADAPSRNAPPSTIKPIVPQAGRCAWHRKFQGR